MLDPKAVDHIAMLARLELGPGDRELFARQLGAILDYVATLKELPTDGVAPLAHAVDATNVFRPDEPRPGLPPDDALGQAPGRQGDFFSVPRVIE
jgi:aspartyl-tRNA(Asn)/glutamyl-tRNA(Gln) amidotransferase subunit C